MKTILKNVQIKAVNSWLPSNSLEMLSLGSLYGESEVNTIMKATGVNRVRIANKDMTSADMCQKAVEALFEQEGIDREEIDGLVFRFTDTRLYSSGNFDIITRKIDVV